MSFIYNNTVYSTAAYYGRTPVILTQFFANGYCEIIRPDGLLISRRIVPLHSLVLLPVR